MQLQFSGQGLRFLSHYAAQSDIRWYLNGVYVKPLTAEAGGGVLGVATNGHMMGMWHDKEGHAERPAILKISKELLRYVGKARKGVWPTLQLIDDRLAAVHEEQELYLQPNPYVSPADVGKRFHAMRPGWEIDDAGKYPSFERVVPKARPLVGAASWYNADLLKKIAQSMSEIGGNRGFNGITLRQVDPNSSTLVTSATYSQAVALIMPMREDVDPVPAWLTRLVEEHGKALVRAALPLPGKQPSDAVPPPGFIVGGVFHSHSGAPA